MFFSTEAIDVMNQPIQFRSGPVKDFKPSQ